MRPKAANFSDWPLFCNCLFFQNILIFRSLTFRARKCTFRAALPRPGPHFRAARKVLSARGNHFPRAESAEMHFPRGPRARRGNHFPRAEITFRARNSLSAARKSGGISRMGFFAGALPPMGFFAEALPPMGFFAEALPPMGFFPAAFLLWGSFRRRAEMRGN